MCGYSSFNPGQPSRTHRSSRFKAAARSWTWTSPAPGSGAGNYIVAQYFWISMLVEQDRFHEALSVYPGIVPAFIYFRLYAGRKALVHDDYSVVGLFHLHSSR